jgi:hypothetical protein
MAKFDYRRAKEEIAHINAIVETCPEAVKEKCFELLFAAVFNTQVPAAQRRAEAPAETPAPPEEKKPDEQKTEQTRQDRKLPPNVLAFARRSGVTVEDIEKLFLLDHEPMLPIYKIPTGNTGSLKL